MSAARLSIPAGLVVGIAVAALVLGGIVLLAPEPVPTAPAASGGAASPSPSIAAPSSAPPSIAAPSSAPPSIAAPSSALPSASNSPSPTGSVGPGSSPASGAFHVGEPAPSLVVPRVGIGPDVMADGLRTIMPGVDVQP